MSDRKIDTWLWDLPAALVLLTRLPLPSLPGTAFDRAARAVWAYPLVGALLGGLACTLGWALSSFGLPPLLVAGLMLAALIMMTGAMHEDGLADTADGLWGGFDRARRLEIMKDSRIGTYGVLALVLAMGLRWQAYAEVHWSALISALVISRAAMPVLMRALPHAREDGLSKTVGTPPLVATGLAIALAAGLAFGLTGAAAGPALILAGFATWGMGALAQAKIGGQTGDILGATQIIVEIAVLGVFVAL